MRTVHHWQIWLWVLALGCLPGLLACDNHKSSGGDGLTRNAELMPPPEGLTATAISPTEVRLTWQTARDTEEVAAEDYEILRDDASLTTVAGETSFVDSELTQDQAYCYMVAALNADDLPGQPSERVCATPRHYIQLTGRGVTPEPPSVVNLVFTASDMDDAPVTDLPSPAFAISEDEIDLDPDQYFQHLLPRGELSFRTPVVIAVDGSAVMTEDHLAAVRSALSTFIDRLFASDLTDLTVGLMRFDDAIQVLATPTADPAALDEALQRLASGTPSCNLYGAAVAACDLWTDSYTSSGITQGHLVLVTLSPDTAALATLNEAVGIRGNRSLFTVGIGPDVDAGDLETLSSAGAHHLETSAGLGEVLEEIAAEVIAFPDEVFLLRYASPKREGRHQVNLALVENTNETPSSIFSASINCDGFESVRPELVISGPGLLTTGGAITLTATPHWVRQPPGISWETASPDIIALSPVENDAATIQVNGSSLGQAAVVVTDTANGLSARHLVGVDSLPLTAVGALERSMETASFTKGAVGAWDSHYVRDPAVIFHGGTYHLWYSGHNGANFQIGYATSSDGLAWTRHGANPVLSAVGDEHYVSAPSVVRTDDGIWHMWFNRRTGTSIDIGYATSQDGALWTRPSTAAVLTPTSGAWDHQYVAAPCVLRHGGGYVMWYSGYGQNRWQIGRAVSSDGITWEKDAGPVMGGGEADWNRNNAMEATVVADELAYAMWVVHSEGLTQRLGYYTSWDGIGWRSGSPDAVLAPLNGDAWDAQQVASPTALALEDRVELFYSGNGAEGWQIGRATYP